MKNFSKIVSLFFLTVVLGIIGCTSSKPVNRNLQLSSNNSYEIKGKRLFPTKLGPNFCPKTKWVNMNQVCLVVVSPTGDTTTISLNLKDRETEQLISSEHSIMAFSIEPNGRWIIYSVMPLPPEWGYFDAPDNLGGTEQIAKWLEGEAEKIANWKTYLSQLGNSQHLIELNSDIDTDRRFLSSPCNRAILFERVNCLVDMGVEDTTLSFDHDAIDGKRVVARLGGRSVKTYLIDFSDNEAREVAEGHPIGFTEDCSRILLLEYSDTTIILSSVETSGGNKRILESKLGIPFSAWTTVEWFPKTGHNVLTFLGSENQHLVFYNLKSQNEECYLKLKLPAYFAISPDGQKVALFRQAEEGIQIEIYDWSKEINALLERIK